jgi:N6-adenosine-specific RNA methylase IME4
LESILKKYDIIYADPPWKYKDTASAGKRGAVFKYNVMDTGSIKALPVKEITSDNCILFLWVTFPMIQEGLDVIKAWGFTYKTVGFNWIKSNKVAPSLFMGMGRWSRSNGEVCLLATKGKPKRISAKVHSVIHTPIEAHSKKPDCTRDRIVELMGDLPRIELFARQKTPGWDVWGDEAYED